ncbi:MULTISPECIES: RDD family protein [Microbacterium]|uniref:RDD family protein n=1 Tax=Microbacterium wangchenii TaxID=2541726 RepID=A0ABX5SRQ9_9MICO|nr:MULTISPECIES: RDD family protein [Microbacterium]MCK6065391.1 RDD family protein [Microbacterium sp. EYE_512]QBR88830.1 RDD family protein [Microbacterium wangchenii]TXK20555.1 RDD family protein [Microbacterium wangchenii]
MPDELPADSYPGERLGLPAQGRGSLAPLGRRVLAIIVDWGCAVVISMAFFSYDALATTTIFVIVQILFIPTIGGSPGHRLFGMRVQRVPGGWPGLWRPIVRSVLLALVIPAVIWDADNRGLHDKAAGTVLVRA